MSTSTAPPREASFPAVEERAYRSGGISADPIYRAIAAALRTRHALGGLVLDVGCGTGNLWPHLQSLFDRYIGADVVRHRGLPAVLEFCPVDLDAGRVPLPDSEADVVAAVETIEHLENPRAFVRELVRLVRPGGWVVVTTPNQLSLLSKLTLVFKNQFNAFLDSCYPAHLTALLESDLRRIARECWLEEVAVVYSGDGRMPGGPWHYPRWLSRRFPRALSDNVLLLGKKPAGGAPPADRSDGER
jgi:2-polyprenyl-3-methyl-5-hydroxy-6-metoxy-1,4-benzoquinol methylase